MKSKLQKTLTAAMIVYSGPVLSEEIILECSSLKFSNEQWLGNNKILHINLATGIIWMNEITDENSGWIKHKLISEHELFIKFKQCTSGACDNDTKNWLGKESYHLIDRITGNYRHINENDGPDFVMFEYDCKRSQKIF